MNLIENAITFSPPGTAITVVVKEGPTEVEVAVKDQGEGISEENLTIIFEKFRILPSSGDRKGRGGTGLALAISKGIIQGHGGRIWAHSEPGRGSTFRFTLPKCRP